MTNFTKLAVVAAFAAVGIASSASAQSFDPEVGSGNVLAFNYAQTAPHNPGVAAHPIRGKKSVARLNGLNAFAMVPSAAAGTAYEAASTGGGSVGYNQSLRSEW